MFFSINFMVHVSVFFSVHISWDVMHSILLYSIIIYNFYNIYSYIYIYICSGVSRILFRGVGVVQNLFGKVRVFAWYEYALRGEATSLLWGFGGMLSEKIFENWNILLKFCKISIVKIFIFLYKNNR